MREKKKSLESRQKFSFDEKKNLPFVVGYHGVPHVRRHSDGGFSFNLDFFEDVWSDLYVLLAFCDLPAGEA